MHRTLDFSANRPMQLVLQLLALVLFFLFGGLFTVIALRLRPDYPLAFPRPGAETLWFLLGVLALTYGVIVLHEAVHGVFFWLFTRERPHFGLTWRYAYAAAPAWYLPRGPMLLTGMAPFVLITLLGLLLLFLAPPGWLTALLIAMTLNAAGAVGDLITAGLLLRAPPTVLANDRGDIMRLYINGKGKVESRK